MKRNNHLKGGRVSLALFAFTPIVLYFVDFRGMMPDGVHRLLHLQLMPALLGGMVGLCVLHAVVALLVGRLYCSVLCPAGILQDIINRLFSWRRKALKGKRRFAYHKPTNALRYGLLAVVGVAAVAGITWPCLLLDPYSNFGRIATSLFRPVVMWVNNLLASLLALADNYTLFQVTITTVTTAGLVAALVALLLLTVMTILRGRLFCNTLCPVGALLSLFSRYSLLRVTFDKERCTHCGNCERSCKAEAIDSKGMTVDMSRCVDCFNCTSACAKGALHYRWHRPALSSARSSAAEAPRGEAVSRRAFLATGASVAASLPLVPALAAGARGGEAQQAPITPPGSGSLARFKELCTGCQLCVGRCPSQVLRPTGLSHGVDYLLKPRMSYENSYCNYECTTCSEVCPTGAIKPLSVEEKKVTQVGIAAFYRERCMVYREEKDCGACSEHCPTQAVHMVPYKGTLTIPEVNPQLCIGCGGCESICPVRPLRAIIVQANEAHKQAQKPAEEEVKTYEVDDFGF